MKMKKIIVLMAILGLMSFTHNKEKIDVFMVGDSTMSNKKPEVYPETGWGQVLGEFFDENVTVHNHAVNGRSSKSFIDEGRWKVVLDSLKAGDYVLIQFGHNDQKIKSPERYTEPYGEYTQNLKKYVEESRAKGATPILLTSIVRRKFDENGNLIDTHGDYPEAMRKVAQAMDVPLIDMQKLTQKLVQNLGDEESKKLYLWTDNPTKKHPDGRQDNTHLCVEGAKKIAGMAAGEIARLDNGLSQHVATQN